ncbi:MAG TPA: hypothetical protein VG498_21680 [Terriglobales bacterium]|nr:hypothetical protein [Terriglobales bacterium]
MPNKDKSEVQGTRIHLVDSSARSQREDTHLQAGAYTADIVVSKTGDCCYYVLQRVGSAEIIDMDRFDTPDDARTAAKHALERWNQQDYLRRVAS